MFEAFHALRYVFRANNIFNVTIIYIVPEIPFNILMWRKLRLYMFYDIELSLSSLLAFLKMRFEAKQLIFC